jgi:hypothetical protein
VNVPAAVAEKVRRLVETAGGDLESVLYYEHPLTVCGLVIVVSDGAAPHAEALGRIYQVLLAPPPKTIHCCRRRELFHLALPGSSSPPFVDDQPHLAHCVKYRSVLLHGRDCRPEIPLPAQPVLFLLAHVRGCRHHMRLRYLKRLLSREHRTLGGELVVEARRLLSIALLGAGGWQIDLDRVTERFAAERPGEAAGVAGQLEILGGRLQDGQDGDGLGTDARDAAWLFERLLDLLEREAA